MKDAPLLRPETLLSLTLATIKASLRVHVSPVLISWIQRADENVPVLLLSLSPK